MYKLLSSLSPEREVIGRALVEGRRYYLVLEEPGGSLAMEVLRNSVLTRHVTWHPGNRVAELRIDQFIGKLRIFDNEYDVRSEKFGGQIDGDAQLKLIVSELDDLSKGISFSYDTGVFSFSQTDWDRAEQDYIYRLNYLYSHFFSDDKKLSSVAFFFLSIKRDSFLSYSRVAERRGIWRVNRVSPSIVKELVKSGAISDGAVNSSAGYVTYKRDVLSKNNVENQFVRFFFEYCEGVALRVVNFSGRGSSLVKARALRLLHECRRILNDEFFSGIDRFDVIGTNSTVLSRRLGYREIYQLYITSLFSLKHVYKEVISSFRSSLIDISSLYEVWCFYKVATAILGRRIKVTEKGCKVEGGKVRYSTTFENERYAVSYNRTFSPANRGSYSTMLRPDISVFSKNEGRYYHFDAKYRVRWVGDEVDDSERKYKNDDVNKMHAYLDSIYGSNSAVALYPGDVYQFFVRESPPRIVTNVDDSHPLRGVGALPLLPGSDNELFFRFIEKYFR